MRTPSFAALMACIALSAVSTSALAYNVNPVQKWSSGMITLNKAWWIPYSADHNDALEEAESIIYSNASSAWLNVQTDDDYDLVGGNWESEINFTDSLSLLCGNGSDGCCHTWVSTSTGQIVEADVYFKWTRSWEFDHDKTGTHGYGGGERPLINTALHEFGHAMGLGHEANIYNIMGHEYTHLSTNGNRFESAMGEDATSGLRALYGSTSGGFEDLALSHWAFDRADSAGYSLHRRTRLLDQYGYELYAYYSNGEPVYYVPRGSWIQVEATIENNGVQQQVPALYYMLSTDNSISTADTFLGYTYPWLSADAPTTFSNTVWFPSTLTAYSTYYIGGIIDPGNAISERNEANNAVYFAAVIPY